MDVSDPQSLAPALISMLQHAANQAQQAPNTVLQNVFDQLGDLTQQARQIAGDALSTLQNAYDHPDWGSLLMFVMLKLQKALGDPAIWVGAYQPAGWSRMVTLNYSPGAHAGAPPPPPILSVGLALTDLVNPTAKRGVRISVTDVFTYQFPPAVTGLTGALDSGGATEWEWVYPFSGPPSAVGPAPVSATAHAHIEWNPGWSNSTPVYSLTLGALSADINLGASQPLYQVQAGLGPIGGTLTPQGALGNGLASSLLALGDVKVSYHPSVTLAQNIPPSFSLGS